jgi:hypothetical protein
MKIPGRLTADGFGGPGVTIWSLGRTTLDSALQLESDRLVEVTTQFKNAVERWRYCSL